MAEAFNPYAPPQSTIDAEPTDATGVYREGKLVRMEVEGRLPDRCIRCNQPAEGYRLERVLYWRPDWWRAVFWAGLPGLFVLGFVDPVMMVAFLLASIGSAVGDFFVRRKIAVEYGVCRGHQRLRMGVFAGFALSWIVLIGLAGASSTGFRTVERWWFWVVVLAMLALAAAASGLYRIRIARLTEHHMWLKGTGRAFHEALPVME